MSFNHARFIIDYNRAKAEAPFATTGAIGHMLHAMHAGTGYADAQPGDHGRIIVDAITWAIFTAAWRPVFSVVLAEMTGRELVPLFNPQRFSVGPRTPRQVAELVEEWLLPHVEHREMVERDRARGAGISERAPVGLG